MLFFENAENDCAGVYAFSTFFEALLNGLMAPKKSKKKSEFEKAQVKNAPADTDNTGSEKSNDEISSAEEDPAVNTPKATATPSVGGKAVRKKEQTQIPDEPPQEKEEPAEATEESTHSSLQTTFGEANKEVGLQEKQPAGFTSICNSVVILLVLAVLCIFAAILVGPPEPEMKTDFDFVKIFENKVSELQSSFTNQTDRFWKILRNRGLAHLRNTNPPQPLVLLLAAPPPAHDVVDCLATKLAKVLDPRHKRTLAMIDGTEERRIPGEKAKKKMDKLLIEKFKAGHRAALVHHLELLPPPSPLLFYSYCDDQNAPHKHVAIIFTVHLPAEPDLSLPPHEAEGTVEKYLSKQVWAREDQDAVAALLSRVADTVALMNGESSDSVKAFCF